MREQGDIMAVLGEVPAVNKGGVQAVNKGGNQAVNKIGVQAVNKGAGGEDQHQVVEAIGLMGDMAMARVPGVSVFLGEVEVGGVMGARGVDRIRGAKGEQVKGVTGDIPEVGEETTSC